MNPVSGVASTKASQAFQWSDAEAAGDGDSPFNSSIGEGDEEVAGALMGGSFMGFKQRKAGASLASSETLRRGWHGKLCRRNHDSWELPDGDPNN